MEWTEQEAALMEKRELKNFDGGKLNDSELLQLIRDRVGRSPYLNRDLIEVEVRNGAVLLTGEVSSEANKLRLSELIESMPSVNVIRNATEVRKNF